jgi:hypothetical protein
MIQSLLCLPKNYLHQAAVSLVWGRGHVGGSVTCKYLRKIRLQWLQLESPSVAHRHNTKLNCPQPAPSKEERQSDKKAPPLNIRSIGTPPV